MKIITAKDITLKKGVSNGNKKSLLVTVNDFFERQLNPQQVDIFSDMIYSRLLKQPMIDNATKINNACNGNIMALIDTEERTKNYYKFVQNSSEMFRIRETLIAPFISQDFRLKMEPILYNDYNTNNKVKQIGYWSQLITRELKEFTTNYRHISILRDWKTAGTGFVEVKWNNVNKCTKVHPISFWSIFADYTATSIQSSRWVLKVDRISKQEMYSMINKQYSNDKDARNNIIKTLDEWLDWSGFEPYIETEVLRDYLYIDGAWGEIVDVNGDKFDLVTRYVLDENDKVIVQYYAGVKFIYEITTNLNKIPIIPLYDNKDERIQWPISTLSTIIDEQIWKATTDSLKAQQAVAMNNPTWVVNNEAGIDSEQWSKSSGVGGNTFPCNGDPNNAVARIETFAFKPEILEQTKDLTNSMEYVTGVNGVNTGAKSGSFNTASGYSQLLQQNMLQQSASIITYNDFIKEIARTMIDCYKKNLSSSPKKILGSFDQITPVRLQVKYLQNDMRIFFDVEPISQQTKLQDQQTFVQFLQMVNQNPDWKGLITPEILVKKMNLGYDTPDLIQSALKLDSQKQAMKSSEIVQLIVAWLKDSQLGIQTMNPQQLLKSVQGVISGSIPLQTLQQEIQQLQQLGQKAQQAQQQAQQPQQGQGQTAPQPNQQNAPLGGNNGQ